MVSHGLHAIDATPLVAATEHAPVDLRTGFRHRIHPIHIGITGYAGYVALKELNEELYDLGHHHGLAMLVASRLCRTLATIEDKAMHELPSLKKMLVAQTTMHILCAGAVVAAGWEVWNDLKPGGHHGMVLLAIHEVHELLEEADWDPKHHKALHSATLKFVIAGGALACAVAELVEDLVPGAHHGVALLAASHVLVVYWADPRGAEGAVVRGRAFYPTRASTAAWEFRSHNIKINPAWRGRPPRRPARAPPSSRLH